MSEAADRDEVVRVTLAHLTALREGRFGDALALSVQELRGRFSPETFRETALAGYGPLLASTRQSVESVETRDDVARCRLALTGPGGEAVLALFELIREHEGWRVAGIALGATLQASVSLNGGRRRR